MLIIAWDGENFCQKMFQIFLLNMFDFPSLQRGAQSVFWPEPPGYLVKITKFNKTTDT